jgi:hypothetical protein
MAVAAPVKPDVKYPWTKEVEQKLRQVFGLPRFRLHQKEAIDETMAGKDGAFGAVCRSYLLTASVRVDAYWRWQELDL